MLTLQEYKVMSLPKTHPVYEEILEGLTQFFDIPGPKQVPKYTEDFEINLITEVITEGLGLGKFERKLFEVVQTPMGTLGYHGSAGDTEVSRIDLKVFTLPELSMKITSKEIFDDLTGFSVFLEGLPEVSKKLLEVKSKFFGRNMLW